MKFSKILTLCLMLIVGAFYWWTSQPAEHSVENSTGGPSTSWIEVVDYAREHLPTEGELKRKSDGFVYLKVDDHYIHTLFPMLSLQEKGFREPPYFRTSSGLGAHISVFNVDEHVVPKELGQIFHFKIKRIKLVNTYTSTYAVLQVESPELEKLRLEYGLPAKLHGKDYHISLAKRIRKH